MRFSARSSLYVHTKKHREPAKGVIYFCPLEGCNSRYKSKTQLRTHIEKHYKKQLPTVASTGQFYYNSLQSTMENVLIF